MGHEWDLSDVESEELHSLLTPTASLRNRQRFKIQQVLNLLQATQHNKVQSLFILIRQRVRIAATFQY